MHLPEHTAVAPELREQGRPPGKYTLLLSFLLVTVALTGIVTLIALPTPILTLSPRTFFPISVFLGYTVVLGTAIFVPEWSIFSFFAVLPLLYIAGTALTFYVGDYPVTPLSIAVWSLWLMTCVRPRRKRLLSDPLRTRGLPLAALLAASFPALILVWNDREELPLLLSLYVTGILEPFLLYHVIARSIENHGNQGSVLWATVASVVLGVVYGVMQTSALGIAGYSSTSDFLQLRSYSFSFGNANLYGMVLVLVFPLSLMLASANSRNSLSLVGWLTSVVLIVTAVLTVSRGILIVIMIELLFFLYSFLRRVKVLRIMIAAVISTAVLASFFPEVIQLVQDRLGQSTFISVVVPGKAGGNLSQNDLERQRIWIDGWTFLVAHPLGGANAYKDVEGLFLQTAVHFGWASALILVITLGYTIGLSLGSARNGEGVVAVYGRAIAYALIGFSIYGLGAGSALSHIAPLKIGPVPQNAGTLFWAALLAVAWSLPQQRMPVIKRSISRD